MKKILALILTLSMLLTMSINATINVAAAEGDGVADFEDVSFTPPALYDGSEKSTTVSEDGYSFSIRNSHYGMSWDMAENLFGKNGNSLRATGIVTTGDTYKGDPCHMITLTPPTTYLTSTDQYYQLSYDIATTGPTMLELIGKDKSSGNMMQIFTTSKAAKHEFSSDTLGVSKIFSTEASAWYNIKFIVKSANVSATSGGGTITDCPNEYWIYVNDKLVSNGITGFKVRSTNPATYLKSFTGFSEIQFRATSDFDSATQSSDVADKKTNNIKQAYTMAVDNVNVSVSDSFPCAKLVSQSETFDFSSYVSNSEMACSNWEVTSIRNENDSEGTDLFKYTNTKNQYGKGLNDSAFHMTHTFGTYNGSDSSMISFINESTVTSRGVAPYYELSFDMAYEGGAHNKQIRLYANTDSGNTTMLYLLNILASGKVNFPFFNLGDIYTMPQKTWNNFRFVIKPNTGTMTVNETEYKSSKVWIYIDGVLLVDGHEFVSRSRPDNNGNMTYYNGFNYFYNFGFLTNTGLKVGITYAPGDIVPPSWSIDNMKVATYAVMPERGNAKVYMNFDNMTITDDIATVNTSLATNYGMFNSVTARTTHGGDGTVEAGLFGKKADDRFVSLWLDGEHTDPTHMIDITSNRAGMPEVSAGDYMSVEAYIAWEQNCASGGIQGFYKNTVSNDGKGPMLLKVNPGSGAVSVLETASTSGGLESKKWHKFNIVIHAGSDSAENTDDKNWFKLYIDDELAIDKTVFVPTLRDSVTADSFIGITRYWFQNVAAMGSTSGKMYFDDFSVEYIDAEPEFSPVKLKSTDENIIDYNGTDSLLCGFIDERNTDISKYSATDPNAVVTLADSIKSNSDNYFLITNEDGSKLYGDLIYKTTVVREIPFGSSNGSELNVGQKNFTKPSWIAGLGGKADDDYALKMTTTDIYNDNNDSMNPFVQSIIGTSGTVNAKVDSKQPFNVASSVIMDGEFTGTKLQFISSGTVDNRPSVVTFNPNGNVYVRKMQDDGTWDGGTELEAVATYNFNEWQRVQCNIYPAVNKIEIILNGELVATQQLFSTECQEAGSAYVYRFKWEQSYDTKLTTADTANGYMAIDDFDVYSGSRSSAKSIATTGTFLDNVDNGEGDILTVTGKTFADIDIVDANNNGSVVTVYQSNDFDNDKLVTSGDVNTGNILVIKSDKIYKYYYLLDEADVVKPVAVKKIDNVISDSKTFVPVIYYSAPESVDDKFIIASYLIYNDSNDVDMEDCDVVDLKGNTLSTYDGNGFRINAPEVTINMNDEVDLIKCLVWKDLDSLVPLCESFDSIR